MIHRFHRFSQIERCREIGWPLMRRAVDNNSDHAKVADQQSVPIGVICGALSENHAFKFEAGRAEIDEQSALAAGRFEVIDQLGLLFAGQGVESFDFHNDGIEAKKVGPIGGFQGLSFVVDGQGMLRCKTDFARVEFQLQGFLENSFQKTGSQRAVDFHCRTNNQPCLGILIHEHK